MRYFVEFIKGPKLPLDSSDKDVEEGICDDAVEEARTIVEKEVGSLPEDPRTGYPSFTITDEDGNEIGGG